MKILNCKIIRKETGASEKIAFTFDDGPHQEYTPMLLDILEEKEGRGTFFFTGQNISNNRNLAKEVVKRGHLIGNHTFSHLNALFSGKKKLRDEILRTKELIEDITGKPNQYLRPPYGIITPALISICKELNLSIVLWSINSFDFRRKSADRIINRVCKKIRSGSIILFHECHFRNKNLDYSNTVTALKTVLDNVILKGLKSVTVGELVEE
jgi:peptidoglycan/xylan/chitin deacetylase (PgdA/CDA1 family)